MKREEKNTLSKQRILNAALEEFSRAGYEGASLNAVWAEKGLSKGIIYHYYKDKAELYLLCVQNCFDSITAYLRTAADALTGTVRDRLQSYFDARIRFFDEYPEYLGIFVDASFAVPDELASQIAGLRQAFDALNLSVLTGLLQSEPLRPGLSARLVADDFRMYMDYFNMHFKIACDQGRSPKDILREHEEKCHRHLDILLYGVLDRKTDSRQ